MAYDEELVHRIRALLGERTDVTEKRMFGGLAFMIRGHMTVSVSGRGGLLLRVDPGATESLIAEPHASRFEMRGREMDGWLRIDPQGVISDEELRRWVSEGLGYVDGLPPKAVRAPR